MKSSFVLSLLLLIIHYTNNDLSLQVLPKSDVRYLQDSMKIGSLQSDPLIENHPMMRTVRVYGYTAMGYYYMNLFVGSNMQKMSLIVDTASTLTAIPCKSCGDLCGKRHLNSPFDPDKSITYQSFKIGEFFGRYQCRNHPPCSFSIAYTEGSSYGGTYVKDYMTFGNDIEDYLDNEEDFKKIEKLYNKRKVFSVFGCIDRETKHFYEQRADGILGFGIQSNTRDYPPSLVEALGFNQINYPDSFSICYAEEGGYLTLGGYNKAHHYSTDRIKLVPYHTEFGQFRINLLRVEYQGKNLGVPVWALNFGQGCFFDSGATLMAVVPLTYDAIIRTLETHCSNPKNCGRNSETYSKCWLYDDNEFPEKQKFFDTFPAFSFTFGRAGMEGEYVLKGEDYLYETNPYLYCFGIERSEDRTILGGTFMRNHDIYFDKQKKLIGFVRANCSGVMDSTYPLDLDSDEEQTDDEIETMIKKARYSLNKHCETDSDCPQKKPFCNCGDCYSTLMCLNPNFKLNMSPPACRICDKE